MRYESADYDDSIDDDPDTPAQPHRLGSGSHGMDSTVDWPAVGTAEPCDDEPGGPIADEHVWERQFHMLDCLVSEQPNPDELRWFYAIAGMTLLSVVACVVCAILAWWWQLFETR